jgi:hypothetical protein
VHLDSPGIGDGVDGALGEPARPLGSLGDDQAATFQGLDHRVKRPVIEPNALVHLPLAKSSRDLIGVHRSLVEADEHREGERVASIARRHSSSISDTMNRVTEIENSEKSASACRSDAGSLSAECRATGRL